MAPSRGVAVAVAVGAVFVTLLAVRLRVDGAEEATPSATPTTSAQPTAMSVASPTLASALAPPSPGGHVLTSTLATDGGTPADLYRRGLALESEGNHLGATDAFHAYGDAEPAMRDIAALAAGNNLFAAGDFAAADTDFAFALEDSPDPGTRFLAALRLGNTRLRLGPPEAARAAYEDALARAQTENDKAQALDGLLAVAEDAADVARAAALRRRIVDEAPGSPAASTALTTLETSGEIMTPTVAARVLLAANQPALARSRLQEAPDAPGARVLLARTYLAQGDTDGAVAALADAADAEARWLRATTLRSVDRAAAAAAFGDFAAAYPSDERAADALLRRARLIELDDPSAAAAAFDALASAYPGTEEGREALFRAGLLAWRAGDGEGAGRRWRVLAASSDSETMARAWLWLGRLSAERGDLPGAEAAWHAASADSGVYGLLARARFGGLPAPTPWPTTTPPPGTEDADLAAWLDITPLAWTTALDGVRASRGARRAQAWLDLGERASAVTEARRGMGTRSDGPALAAAWSVKASELGLHDASISAAVAAIGRGPAGAPAVLERLAYPTAYGDAVTAAAEERGVVPALLFGLIRQESLFNPEARSSVGALGLTQVMPETGAHLAQRLGVSGFAPEQLLDPTVAVRFGASFLGDQVAGFDNEIMAVAAYNGGPGNAQRWADEAGNDPELFVETVDFSETSTFIHRVMANRAAYARLYPELAAP